MVPLLNRVEIRKEAGWTSSSLGLWKKGDELRRGTEASAQTTGCRFRGNKKRIAVVVSTKSCLEPSQKCHAKDVRKIWRMLRRMLAV